LDAASKSGGNILPFIEYGVTGFVEELREQIDIVREQHIDVTWVNYVHDQFKDKKSHADRRRRSVVLSIEDTVKIASIPKLTPEIAAEYAGKTAKTVVRDVNQLIEMDLVQRVRGGAIRVKKETILAFLPIRKRENDE
jgi:hypothetical protein